MRQIDASDFKVYFEEIHGVTPFIWQQQLAEQVLNGKQWPKLLDLPTGAGKTAVIDIAVFHLAFEADRGPERCAPVRMLFVIDRRIVVDAAFARATKIAQALRDPRAAEIIRSVAHRLGILSGDQGHPLDVVRLRGGVPQERDWARSPSQPLIAVSTADQVGSRLLFRGYGVSPKMWPIHAGLVGTDAQWFLDEVHLSRPLEETLTAIEEGHAERWLAAEPRLSPFGITRLSATPGDRPTSGVFLLDRSDQRGQEGARQDEKLWQRLEAKKIAQITEWAEGKSIDHFARKTLELITESQRTDGYQRKRIAVLVNTVYRARGVFEKLRGQCGDHATVSLLIGRTRPLDRNALEDEIGPLYAGLGRADPEKALILVATQTAEVGADLDFDTMVTEIAPLDVLRQRFGRLARLGAPKRCEALILCPSSKKPKKDETNEWSSIRHIYGESAYKTRQWLKKTARKNVIDLGVDSADQLLTKCGAEELKEILAPRRNAPVVLAPYAEQWWMTSPASLATPEPSLFLHGCGDTADVQIVWRGDLDPDVERGLSNAGVSLAKCPPSSLETMAVPIWEVKRWLRNAGRPTVGLADVPEVGPSEEDRDDHDTGGRRCFRYDYGSDDWTIATAADLRSGDLIVVPCDYGGADRYGWSPASRKEVTDLGVEAHYVQRQKVALRFHRALVGTDIWQRVIDLAEGFESDRPSESEFACSLSFIPELPELWRRMLGEISKNKRIEVTPYDQDDISEGFVISAKARVRAGLLEQLPIETGEEPGADSLTGRDDSSRTGVRVALADHLRHVEARARCFAYRAGLREKLVDLLALAGSLHDIGKADPRFQADLRGASAFARLGLRAHGVNGELLAKSGLPGNPQAARATPQDFRHEALSVALAEGQHSVKLLSEGDRDIVLWLIGSHHGHGRPFFPPCVDPEPETEVSFGENTVVRAKDSPQRLDQGWFERCCRLLQRFGPWELARLEAILRLADHAASAEEQEERNR